MISDFAFVAGCCLQLQNGGIFSYSQCLVGV